MDFALLSNPNARCNKKDPLLFQKICSLIGQPSLCRSSVSLEELAQVVQEICARKIPHVVVHGGDGTFHQTLNAFLELNLNTPLDLPSFYLLKGGTMNVLGQELGYQGSALKQAQSFKKALTLGLVPKTQSIATIKAGKKYGFIYADASSARLLKFFYSTNKSQLKAFNMMNKLILSALWNGRYFSNIFFNEPLELNSDLNPPYQGCAITVMASTISKLPLGLPLFKLNQSKSSQFKLLIFDTPARKLPFRLYHHLFKSFIGSQGGKTIWQARMANLRRERPFSYTLDGELFEAPGTLELSLGPEIRFLVL